MHHPFDFTPEDKHLGSCDVCGASTEQPGTSRCRVCSYLQQCVLCQQWLPTYDFMPSDENCIGCVDKSRSSHHVTPIVSEPPLEQLPSSQTAMTSSDVADPPDELIHSSKPPHPCSNCGASISTDSEICPRCSALPMCRTCKRHLDISYFDIVDLSRCKSCADKRRRDARRALDGVVREIALPTNNDDASYQEYIQHNEEEIKQVVENHRRQMRYPA